MINPDLYNDKLVNQCVAHSGRPHNDKIIISVTKHDRILSAPYSTCNKLICSSSLKTSARSEISFQYLNTCFDTKYGLTNMLHMCTFTLTSMFCDTLQKLVMPYQLLTYHYTMQMANKFYHSSVCTHRIPSSFIYFMKFRRLCWTKHFIDIIFVYNSFLLIYNCCSSNDFNQWYICSSHAQLTMPNTK